MLQFRQLVVAVVCLVGCSAEVDEGQPFGLTQSELGDNDVNDFRKRTTEPKPLSTRKAECASDPRVVLGFVSADICVGAQLFFREPFNGNGRACGSCHTAQFDFTIGPEFIASLQPDDPLFVAENNPALAGLEKPELLRDHGLILENVDGADAPTTKFVMRSVPHCLGLSTSITPAVGDGTTSPPLQRTGWGGDGAPEPGGLKQFQVGAITQHYTKSLSRTAGTDFTLPTDEALTRIESFLLNIGRTREIDLRLDVRLSDPEADAGRVTYLDSRCNGCHTNAGANNGAGVNRNFDTGIESIRPARLDELMIPRDGGFGGTPPDGQPNHDANHDGTLDSFGNGTFNTPPLIEAADTAPFFHNNGAQTLEDAIAFYASSVFADSPAGNHNPVLFDPTQRANVGKFLRVLNASLNCQIAIARMNAAIAIVAEHKNHFKGLQEGLLDAARAEVRDAFDVLNAVGIHAAERAHLQAADQALTAAFANSSYSMRAERAMTALSEVTAANSGLGTGMDYQVGPGTLLF